MSRRVIDTFDRIAFGYEMLGQHPMRVRAYRNGARILRKFGAKLPTAYRSGELAQIRGIGNKMLDVIGLVLEDKPVPQLQKIEAELPRGLFEIRRIKGLGVKKIQVLHGQLGITTLAELEYACNENRLVELDGFGAKTQTKVIEAIEAMRQYASSFRRDVGRRVAAHLQSILQTDFERVAIVGAFVRGEDSVERVEALVLGPAPEISDVEGVPVLVHGVEQAGEFGRRQVELTAAAPHLERLSQLGLQTADGETDEDVYRALGLEPVPVERRDADFEPHPVGTPYPLLTGADIKGALHNHTDASDGVHSLAAMHLAATKHGFEYFGISDHSVTASYAGGLNAEQLFNQLDSISAANAEGGCHLYSGVESDILADGALDYPPEVLARLDVVVASVHARHRQSAEAMTHRMVEAALNPWTDIIGHPTGRLINGRPPSDYDVDAFLDACAQSGCAVEHNANPQRLDLNATNLAKAKAKGVKVSIAADAHSTMAIDHLSYGVTVARRAGLTPDDVINCWPKERLEGWLAERKTKASSTST